MQKCRFEFLVVKFEIFFAIPKKCVVCINWLSLLLAHFNVATYNFSQKLSVCYVTVPVLSECLQDFNAQSVLVWLVKVLDEYFHGCHAEELLALSFEIVAIQVVKDTIKQLGHHRVVLVALDKSLHYTAQASLGVDMRQQVPLYVACQLLFKERMKLN